MRKSLQSLKNNKINLLKKPPKITMRKIRRRWVKSPNQTRRRWLKSKTLQLKSKRLCRPTFHIENPLRFDLSDIIVGEDLFDDPSAAPQLRRLLQSQSTTTDSSTDLTYTNRFLLRDDPSDAIGLPGMVVLPQAFGIKVRVVKEITYLEACLENNTKSNLYMDQVEFEPTPQWGEILLKADDHYSKNGVLTSEIFKPPVLIKSSGGIHNYFYQLKSLDESAPMKIEGSNILGKLQITWRTNLGEPGRLQTQQILGNPITHKEVELKAIKVPSVIILEKPFTVYFSLTNLSGNNVGPFEVLLSVSDNQEEKAVMVNGLKRMALPQVVEAYKSLDFQLNLIAMELGIKKISGTTVFNTTENKTYDHLPDIEIFVNAY
ncbi:hypothetical protein L2E82_31434 [Cichorium intybus]|uniref:Uncharacterized protein n=1 Tax=Cichorium intybus TaxID=13427 RepID=A0ACB9D315_CICIN|nr:hypothetical protein L2E82_31434 [Cichorium intybus]